MYYFITMPASGSVSTASLTLPGAVAALLVPRSAVSGSVAVHGDRLPRRVRTTLHSGQVKPHHHQASAGGVEREPAHHCSELRRNVDLSMLPVSHIFFYSST